MIYSLTITFGRNHVTKTFLKGIQTVVSTHYSFNECTGFILAPSTPHCKRGVKESTYECPRALLKQKSPCEHSHWGFLFDHVTVYLRIAQTLRPPSKRHVFQHAAPEKSANGNTLIKDISSMSWESGNDFGSLQLISSLEFQVGSSFSLNGLLLFVEIRWYGYEVRIINHILTF